MHLETGTLFRGVPDKDVEQGVPSIRGVVGSRCTSSKGRVFNPIKRGRGSQSAYAVYKLRNVVFSSCYSDSILTADSAKE